VSGILLLAVYMKLINLTSQLLATVTPKMSTSFMSLQHSNFIPWFC